MYVRCFFAKIIFWDHKIRPESFWLRFCLGEPKLFIWCISDKCRVHIGVIIIIQHPGVHGCSSGV